MLVDPQLLLVGFAVLLAAVAVLTWLHARRPEASGAGAGEVSLTQLVPTAFGVGALTGFFGVGGGFVIVPALALGLMTRGLGAGIGGLPWALVVTFALGTGLGTWLGNRVSGRAGGAVLLRAFAVFLALLAVVVGAEALRA